MHDDAALPNAASGSVLPTTPDAFSRYLDAFWQAAGGDPAHRNPIAVTGTGTLASAFPVTAFATAAIGAASLAMAELVTARSGRTHPVVVDQRLASLWFGISLQPQGWTLPPVWDAVAGDYLASDGWIRLHTNAPHHRAAALRVLGTPPSKDAVTPVVARWSAAELEAAIVSQGGCAAAMHSIAKWQAHAQGQAVGAEPLLLREDGARATPASMAHASSARPLAGVRVLDLTRILAGPVATRFLAGYGADVLRIDPPDWDEAVTIPDVVLGKRCARLDLKSPDGLRVLEDLLRDADVLVHGYRPDALARLGLSAQRRREINPALIDVSLDAYGWSGPWQGRRGFDSLIQMSTGIADAGMRAAGRDRPVPLPVQAIDHATGYLLAAAAIRGLTQRLGTGRPLSARASLARTAGLLVAGSNGPENAPPITGAAPDDFAPDIEHTSWGPALRLRPPVSIEHTSMHWALPARSLGSDPAAWQAR